MWQVGERDVFKATRAPELGHSGARAIPLDEQAAYWAASILIVDSANWVSILSVFPSSSSVC